MEWPKKEFKWIVDRTLYASIPFTWCLPSIRSQLMQRSVEWDSAIVGGPATALMPDYFSKMPWVEVGISCNGVLQRVNPLATKTSTGCNRKCKFCAVPMTEGPLKELSDWPDLPIICDNNLLATSQAHFDRVIERLKTHKEVDFNQGIDARLLTKHHASRLAELNHPIIRLALDSMSYVDQWQHAYDILRAAGLPKKSIRSYALIGFDSDPEEAWRRCEWIVAHGIKPLPMWFHALDQLKKNVVTKLQLSLGWSDRERKIIMQYYYQRGKRRALILRDYGWRLKK